MIPPYVIKPAGRFWQGIYLRVLFWVLGRTLPAAAVLDETLRDEWAEFPEDFSFRLAVLPLGPSLCISKSGMVSISSDLSMGEETMPDVSIEFKNPRGAMRVFGFKENSSLAAARNRIIVRGPLPETCRVLRILSRLEILLLPKGIARRAVKRLEDVSQKGKKRFLLYLRVLWAF